MYMRFLRLKVKEESLWLLQKYYVDRVVPELQETPGCLFVSLLQRSVPGEDCLSLTLWTTPEAARDYEESGLFKRLLEEAFALSPPAAAKTGQAHDPAAQPTTSPSRPPEAESFKVLTGRAAPPKELAGRLHVRVVTMRVADGKADETAAEFRSEIIPALLGLKGCLGAFLVESEGRPNLLLSTTLWERDEDAIRYELSGAFDKYTAKIQGMLSSYYQWKHTFAAPGSDEGVTGEDLQVDRYSLVVGKVFPEKGE